jgi:hypothetical protein
MNSIFNYRTSIDLKAIGLDENQLVLASQKFGTFFCVYVNLKKVKDEINSYDMSFNVKTYRGCFPIEIEKVEIEEIISGLTHIKLYIDVRKEQYSKKHRIELKKDNFIIFEREESQDLASSVFINEGKYINLDSDQQDGNETQYQIEKKIVKK